MKLALKRASQEDNELIQEAWYCHGLGWETKAELGWAPKASVSSLRVVMRTCDSGNKRVTL